jgi:hypothetical protein
MSRIIVDYDGIGRRDIWVDSIRIGDTTYTEADFIAIKAATDTAQIGSAPATSGLDCTAPSPAWIALWRGSE